MKRERFVIVGASLAGVRAARAAREAGFEGELILLGGEPALPYQRPPLSKEFLTGRVSEADLLLEPENFYTEQRVEVELGRRAVGLDLGSRRVLVEGGRMLDYDTLLVATGADARRLPVPGAHLEGSLTLRTVEDSRVLAGHLRTAHEVVVVGAGLLGLEVAAVARRQGKAVTVVESGPAPLGRLLPTALGKVVAGMHRAQGVEMRLGAQVAAVRGHGRVEAVELTSGERLSADLLVTAMGVQPAVGWLRGSGVELGDGVLVDEHLRSSAPGVFAAGDVACAWSPAHRRYVRVESFGNASAQGGFAGRAVVGRLEREPSLPGMGTTQFGHRLQLAGRFVGGEQLVLRRYPEGGAFLAFGLRGGRVVALFAVDRPRDILAARTWLSHEPAVPPAHLSDPGFDLRSVRS